MAIFSSKDKDGNICVNFSYVDGITNLQTGDAVNITLENANNRIVIQKRLFKTEPSFLAYTQITNISVVSETEIKEVDKSVIGRAIIGGVLLGPLGAIIGGISGTGTKKSSMPKKKYLIINYKQSSDPSNISVVSFEIVGATIGLDKLVNSIKENCNLIDLSEITNGGYL